MCGIAGILALDCAVQDRAHLENSLNEMSAALRHRGPDDHGIEWIQAGQNRLGLAHTRLSILDLSPSGHQPMHDALTGNCISYNGEIYNFRELRDHLSPREWRSQSDTEVILAAYRKHGIEMLSMLRGMFAFALWDSSRKRLLLVRDRFGIKPLYYYLDAGRGLFLFASEVRALLSSGLVPRIADETALFQYLQYQSVPAPGTMVRDVRMMMPGSWISVGCNGEFNGSTYWDLMDYVNRESSVTVRTKFGPLLEDAVRSHFVSDVPVAVFLSGGMDSTALAAAAVRSGIHPQTFTVGFDESEYDESAAAGTTAKLLGTDHTEVRLSRDEVLALVPAAVSHMDHPSGDGVNTYVVSMAVRNAGIKVAISGVGGDELFGGYPSFRRLGNSFAKRLMSSLPSSLRHLGAAVAGVSSSGQTQKAADILRTDFSVSSAFPILRQLFSAKQAEALLSGASSKFDREDPYVAQLRGRLKKATGVMTAITYAEATTYMRDVLLRDSDQMAMAHSLEIRVPFLDHPLAEFVFGLPDAAKYNPGTQKKLLRDVILEWLPSYPLQRAKKGFALPFSQWMRGPLREYCETRLAPERISNRGLLDSKKVDQLWRGFLNSTNRSSWSRIWILVVLEEWLEQTGVRFS